MGKTKKEHTKANKKPRLLRWFIKNLDESTQKGKGNKSLECCGAKH